MLQTFRNAWRIEELRKKILFTLLIVLLYRLGNAVPVPFVDTKALADYFQASGLQNTILGLFNVMSGGAFSQATIFALSIQPYINASIIIQLLCIAIPALERLQKEGGEEGKKKIASITRYSTVAIGLLQGFAYYMMMRNYSLINADFASNVWAAIEHPQVISDSVNYSKKPWALQPTQMISYVSCHDDMCLADRLKATMPDASVEELAALQKLAETFVFTSQGVPFIFAGDEMMRDKKGVHNSYNSPDSINTIDWKNKTAHKDVFEYVKGLIAMRKAHPAFRMGDADMVRRQLEFLPVENTNVVAFILKDNANGDSWKNIIVALNSRAEPVKLDIPSGKYTVICKDGKINMKGLGQVSGDELMVPARSAMIIHQ